MRKKLLLLWVSHRVNVFTSLKSASYLCFIHIEGDTTIYLKIVIHKPDPPVVKDHMVPLLLVDFKNTPLDKWDLTTQQVICKKFYSKIYLLYLLI